VLRKEGWHWFKIPDSIPGGQSTFSPIKPYDAYGYNGKIFLAVEAKYLNAFRTFGIPDLRDSQLAGLNDAEKAGGVCFVMLLIKFDKLDKINRSKISFDRAFFFPWAELKAKYTYSPNELRQYNFTVDAKNSTYDLTSFFNYLNSRAFLN